MLISEVFDNHNSMLDRLVIPDIVTVTEKYYNMLDLASNKFTIPVLTILPFDSRYEFTEELDNAQQSIESIKHLAPTTYNHINELLNYLE